MNTISPGRYRHHKGNEYTVLGMALHSETQKNSLSTARNTATTAYECARSKCSWKR